MSAGRDEWSAERWAAMVRVASPFPQPFRARLLDRIPRGIDRPRVLAYPGGTDVDEQQELADALIVLVEPDGAEPWVGVFHGGRYGRPPVFPAALLSWPDGRSLCVVCGGAAEVVRSDDPRSTMTLSAFPVRTVREVPELGLVLVGDWCDLECHDAGGRRWSSHVVDDDLEIDDIDVPLQLIHLRGSQAGNTDGRVTVDIRTGEAEGSPRP